MDACTFWRPYPGENIGKPILRSLASRHSISEAIRPPPHATPLPPISMLRCFFFPPLGRRLVDSSPTLKWGVRGWALLGEWSIHWNTIPDIFSRVWFGFLAGQGCDAFANLFVTPTLTLNLNTSAYRPHALQVLEACGGTADTDRRHHEWY